MGSLGREARPELNVSSPRGYSFAAHHMGQCLTVPDKIMEMGTERGTPHLLHADEVWLFHEQGVGKNETEMLCIFRTNQSLCFGGGRTWRGMEWSILGKGMGGWNPR